MQAQGKVAGEFFSNIKNQALGLITVLLGGKGLSSLIQDSVTSLSAMGRAARNMGVAIPELAAFRNVIEANGGSAEAAAASMQGLADAISNMAAFGGNPMLRGAMATIGAGGLKDPIEVVKKYAAYIDAHPLNVGFNRVLGHSLGLDESTINIAMKGSVALENEFAEARKRSAADPETVKRMQALQESWYKLRQEATKLWEVLFAKLAPALTLILKTVREWMEGNESLATTIGIIVAGLVAFRAILLALRLAMFLTGVTSLVSGLSALSGIAGLGALGGLLATIATALAALAAAALLWYGIHPTSTQTQDDENKIMGRPPGTGPMGEPPGTKSTGPTRASERMRKFFGLPATAPQAQLGLSSEQYGAFREAVAGIESHGQYNIMGGSSGRFAGRYQMGATEIAETAKQLGEPVPSQQAFLRDPAMQDRFFQRYTLAHHQTLMQNAKYAAMTPAQQAEWLGYAHNQGAAGASRAIDTGKVGSDAFHTPGTAYNNAIRLALGGLQAQRSVASVQAATQRGTSGTSGGAGQQNVNVNGPIHISTQATDAKGIARSLRAELSGRRLAAHANTGLA